MTSLIPDILATVLGGLAFTLILFTIKEYILPKKNITGKWKITTHILTTEYNPHKNLQIEFEFHLLHKENEIIGRGEKIKDIHPNNKIIIYKPDEKISLDISGSYVKKYLRKSDVYLNIQEKGSSRDSSTTYFLKVSNKNNLNGHFKSSVSNSSGEVTITRL